MIAISDKLRHQVMKLAEQYEKPEFITDDPVQFPRRFGYKCSQEIVGFIAAWLAYGNRKAILSTCEKLCKEMEHLTPYMYIKNMGWRKYIDSEEPLYRFFKEKDFADLCRALKEIYDNNEDMEEALSKNYTRTMGATDYLDVTEFTNMELPEPLFKVIRLSDGEVVKDKDDNPLQNLTESEATDKVVFLMEANPKPQEQFTYVPMLWEVPHEPEQAPQPKEKIIHMNPKKQ